MAVRCADTPLAAVRRSGEVPSYRLADDLGVRSGFLAELSSDRECQPLERGELGPVTVYYAWGDRVACGKVDGIVQPWAGKISSLRSQAYLDRQCNRDQCQRQYEEHERRDGG